MNHLMNTVKKTDTHHPLAELLEQFWQLKDQFTSLKSTAYHSTSTTELTQLTDKLQHFTMILQLYSAPLPSEEPAQIPCRHTWISYMQH